MNWIEKKIFRWRLKRNLRRHYRRASAQERKLLKDEYGKYFYRPVLEEE